ncbi:MAG: MBL fold metallo-hydrolase [Aristaeellaceae bacterium]
MIDFSCKHDIWLEDEDGSLQRMDEPFFRSWRIAPGTWQILSDGDFSYLVEGDEEAILIDSGYGCGNIRAYAQSLTDKPLSKICNTHDHFDHTANNSYFDLCYMSRETQPLATRPFPSFAGIDFPRDYAVELVTDGDVIPLKGRPLQVFQIPDHAVGSLAFLDEKERILFSGDEFMLFGKSLHGSVAHWARMLEKLLAVRDRFDRLCAGAWPDLQPCVIEQQYACARHILDGFEGLPVRPGRFPGEERVDEQGRRIWKRRIPHPGDGPKNINDGIEYRREMKWAGTSITYDVRHIDD